MNPIPWTQAGLTATAFEAFPRIAEKRAAAERITSARVAAERAAAERITSERNASERLSSERNAEVRTAGERTAAGGNAPVRSAAGPGTDGEAGFTLVETLGALLVSTLVLALIVSLWQRGADALDQAAAAWHLREVTEAAHDYVEENAATLAENASQNSGPTLSVSDLVEAGHLPRGFRDRNPWNQTCTVHVRALPADGSDEDTGGRLFVLVLTHGGRGADWDADDRTFLSVTVPGAARRAGPVGGFIPADTADSAHGYGPDTLVGGSGGFALRLADFGLESPGPGHLGAYSAMRATGGTGDFLYRVPVEGHPEANQMTVNIDMTGNAVVNLGYLGLVSHEPGAADRPAVGRGDGTCDEDEVGRLFLDEDHGLYLCRRVNGEGTPVLALVSDTANTAAVRSVTLAADGDLVPKPVCAPDTGTVPRVFLAPAVASSGPDSPALTAFRAYATEEGTNYRVHLRVKNTEHDGEDEWYGADGEGTLAHYYGAVQVVTACVRP